MSNKEEEFLLNEASKNEIRIPLFEAPDGKIMAIGDMFRGPYTGISSEIDLNNPGNKLSKEEEMFD
ncbi:hypothetical protein DFO70_12642 [Cytobacillus firmus]|uniref:Uncharacterized protein n=2 Tax=Cytobacillus TaxID=2675230 RepID=A0A366JIT2_CYTFI|nr:MULTISPECIES: hypothetical protein [Cytobacillus]RBP86434.1 hypothetical protein DFO70_12642 [Cytobacillus firmus]TDX36472.1 hypothetical protein DFO72_11942 [Cytobacillus oceanisediminis]